MTPRRLFAGSRLRAIRAEHRLKQAELAARLAISTSYLSQLENDDRPLTPALVERLSRAFPLDWREIGAGDAETRLAALREANADPLFAEPLDAAQLARAQGADIQRYPHNDTAALERMLRQATRMAGTSA